MNADLRRAAHGNIIVLRVFSKLLLALAGAGVILLASAAWRFAHAPRAWTIEETPVAFWSWRTDAPDDVEIQTAIRETRFDALFLRAGQIDYENETSRRIRPAAGRFPRAIEIHLVYNATPALLENFERLDIDRLAATITETYCHDAERAARDGARVRGLQLDFDSPTRLLPRYAEILRRVRARLPGETQLSVTGLPTWMDSQPRLAEVLDAVDFWIPQFYGAQIPDTLAQAIPITSPREVARDVARAREFGRPFYAGLAAYDYAILYATNGAALELRGDIDAARVARDGNFELTERRVLDAESGLSAPGSWRYVFRARMDSVLDGMTVRAGESLVIFTVGAETLRQSARAVRAGAGEHLRGICIFRLPTRDDPTTLTIRQIGEALRDSPAAPAVHIRLEESNDDRATNESNHLRLILENTGTASAPIGDDALSVTVRVPRGSVRGVAGLDGFSSYETLCDDSPARPSRESSFAPRPCSARRANLLQLRAAAWTPGRSARATLVFSERAPRNLTLRLTSRTNDGREWTSEHDIPTNRTER